MDVDLALNHNAEFTKWVVRRGLLTEPFVLINVGVQGGEHIRWRPLDDYLIVPGFDPIEEVVQKTGRSEQGPLQSSLSLYGRGKRRRRAEILL